MNKTVSLILCCCLLFSLCACARDTEETSSERVQIIATVFPAYDFAREVAGELADVTLLVPPGSETHSFEPSAKELIRISECDLLVCNGGESEVWLEEILAGLDGEVRVLRMLDCVEALEEEIQEGMQTHEEDADETEYDEHCWTSPKNAALISCAIAYELSRIDLANAAEYTERCSEYCRRLDTLDAEFRAVVESSSHRTLVFADRFPVRYFTEEYALRYYAAFPGCADDAEPSARTVAFLIDRVKEAQLPAVLYIEFSNEKMADVIVEDTGCKKLLFHSCHNVSASELDSGASYLSLMTGNLQTLKEALA